MKTVALFGGSFDPPHIGHEAVVKAALNFKEIQKVVVMPAFLNPFKTSHHHDSELRFKLLQKMFQDYDRVEVSSFEVDKKRSVASIESVLYLLKKYKKIYLIIGADNLSSLKNWHRYEELEQRVTFLVATRGDILIPKSFLTLSVDEDISSTQIRNKLKVNLAK